MKNFNKILIAIIAISAVLGTGLYLNANKNPENALLGAIQTKRKVEITIQGSVIDSITKNNIKDHNELVTCTAFPADSDSPMDSGTGQLDEYGTFQSIISKITPNTANED